jgi:hypothetical protein
MTGPRLATTNWFRLVNVNAPAARAPRPRPAPRLVARAAPPTAPAVAPAKPPAPVVLAPRVIWSNRVAA